MRTLLNLYNGMIVVPGRMMLERSNAVPQYCGPQIERECMRQQFRRNYSWSQRLQEDFRRSPPGEWEVENMARKCRLWKPSMHSWQWLIKKAQMSSSTLYCMFQKHTNLKYSFMQPGNINIICSNENVPIPPISFVYQKSNSEIEL